MADQPTFQGGRNIAMKVPPHQFDATITFYRDVLGLEALPTDGPSSAFRFGAGCLWIDRCPQLSRAEIWLELQTSDTDAAARYLKAQGVTRCDEIEPLPHGFDGFWIADPAGTVNLVADPTEDPGR